ELMANAWLQIPLADYEAHMALPSVGQAQLLATAMCRVTQTFQPRSMAVLGAAGGNGFHLVDPQIVSRIVAIDVNREYLCACTKRRSWRVSQFEAVWHDLSQGPPAIVPVDCVFAGLVLEYLQQEPC